MVYFGYGRAGNKHSTSCLLVWQGPLQTAVRRSMQRCCHSISSALAACYNLCFVESQTVDPKDLMVICHIVLPCRYLHRKCDAYLHFTAVLNDSGETAQFPQNGCSISAVEVCNFWRNTKNSLAFYHFCCYTVNIIHAYKRYLITKAF